MGALRTSNNPNNPASKTMKAPFLFVILTVGYVVIKATAFLASAVDSVTLTNF